MSDDRIEQFRRMAEADPQNELGHFSLGRALLDAGRHQEAVTSFERVIEINPRNSRAYHLLAVARKEAGDKAAALAALRKGLEVAHERGDLMPRNDMAALMRELGEEPPAFEATQGAAAVEAPAGADNVMCRRCGQARPKMAKRPFKGPLGEQVWANTCQSCWDEWIRMGTKVINELRLNFAIPRHAEMYDQHMKEFLNLDAPADGG
ncbi:MAG TPA: Fe(2+)-trafficking protein [Phycisphaerae bacterium]|jgi:Fe-S cluster biosynthesis and repair protein YggX|nr:tetratricopeptide repeat protein [Phycisphaerae bacterium]HOB75151.1 Fe(2+)-trafficking protein [Phycisphaerae bacterium]HOJ54627.1 Fe(2+)-trafficking protein [Phycisphaerae bacterium]HOL27253.1 Fe(2+)-trafficking protein [Phycisphaerae bacterium]HPP21053.1 Fe(2+)-trafficking protein [Phycisphaerae bacterium]